MLTFTHNNNDNNNISKLKPTSTFYVSMDCCIIDSACPTLGQKRSLLFGAALPPLCTHLRGVCDSEHFPRIAQLDEEEGGLSPSDSKAGSHGWEL